MAKLGQRPGTAARALEFTILAAARSGETFGMTWGEVDLDAKLWTVPGSRMKAGEEHQVPLSVAALALLRSVKPDRPHASANVFHNGKGSRLSNMAMTAVLRS
jgi:integrase